MNVKEFKKLFPKQTPGPLMDWMGNIVKAGDVIIIFRTRHFITGDVMTYYLNSNKKPEIAFHIPDDFIWEKLSEHTILNLHGKLMFKEDIGGVTLISGILNLTMRQNSDILCIKGKSDDKGKYIQFMGGVYSESEN